MICFAIDIGSLTSLPLMIHIANPVGLAVRISSSPRCTAIHDHDDTKHGCNVQPFNRKAKSEMARLFTRTKPNPITP